MIKKTDKILIAGDFSYFIYERAVINSLNRLGYENVLEFSFDKYLKNILGKIERYLMFIGICSFFMNISLVLKIVKEKPRVLFIWRGILISTLTLKLIKKFSPTTILVSYNNDDPFSIYYKKNIHRVSLKNRINQKRIWKYFIKSLPYYDKNFVYREKNIKEYEQAGAKNVKLFMPYYVPEQIPDNYREKKYDVIFIGHYENDGRDIYIKKLIDNNIDVHIFGTGWNASILKQKEIMPLYGDDYFNAIKSAKIALVFMSKRNNDEYTRRCFEIPACGTMMLSEETATLKVLYLEDEEIVFFDTPQSLLDKVKYFLKDERYKNVGNNAKNRAELSGYDIDSVVKKLVLEF